MCQFHEDNRRLDILSPWIPRHFIVDTEIALDLCYAARISKGTSTLGLINLSVRAHNMHGYACCVHMVYIWKI